MLDADTIEAIADIVDHAQSHRHTIDKITDAHPAMTIDDGYSVQDALLRRWEGRGRRLYGYKAGLTSRAKMIQMNVDVPSFGMLMRDTCDAEGGAIPTEGLIHPRVEAEIAFVTKAELSGPDCDVEALADYLRNNRGHGQVQKEIVEGKRQYKIRAVPYFVMERVGPKQPPYGFPGAQPSSTFTEIFQKLVGQDDDGG